METNFLSRVIDACLLTIVVALVILNFSLVLLVSRNPQAIPYIGFLFPKEYYGFSAAIFTCLFHVVGQSSLCQGLCFVCSAVMIYLFYIPHILGKELRVGRPTSCYTALGKLRQVENIRIAFRSFQVLHYNEFCYLGIFVLLCNWGCIVTSVNMLFVLLRYGRNLKRLTKIPMVMAAGLTIVVWGGILHFGKVFHLRCKKVFVSWKRHDWGSSRERKIMERFALSCRPIKISYGTIVVVGPMSVLQFIRNVKKYTIKLLISTR